MMKRRNTAAAERFAERRRREQDAPRLADQVPSLVSLEISIDERSGACGVKHTRRVVVDQAPALFLLPCGDSRCEHGEHDLTTPVMQALRAHETQFHGSDSCMGSLGPAACGRVVHFDVLAHYRP
jgi:hypothetical protein